MGIALLAYPPPPSSSSGDDAIVMVKCVMNDAGEAWLHVYMDKEDDDDDGGGGRIISSTSCRDTR